MHKKKNMSPERYPILCIFLPAYTASQMVLQVVLMTEALMNLAPL